MFKKELYFVALDVSVQQYREGFCLSDGVAFNFFELAAFIAKNQTLDLYIKDMANECMNKGVLFKDISLLTPGFFNRKVLCLYANCLESILSLRSVFVDCDVFLFVGMELEPSAKELAAALFQNNVIVFDSHDHASRSFNLLFDFQNAEAVIAKNYRKINEICPVTMGDEHNKILVLSDKTWRGGVARFFGEISKLDSGLEFIVVDAGSDGGGLAPDNAFVDIDKVKFSEFDELLDHVKCIIYGGVSSLTSIAILQFAWRRAIPSVLTASMSIASGIKPNRYFHEFNNGDIRSRAREIVNWMEINPSMEIVKDGIGNNKTDNDGVSIATKIIPSTIYNLHEAARSASRSSPGVRVFWIGRFDFVGGYGAVARGYLSAMEAAGIPCLCVDINSKKPVGKSTGFFWEHDPATRCYTIDGPAILILNDLPTKFQGFKSDGFVKRIGCTLFETDSFPIDWNSCFRSVDEIWVPTEFNKKTFSQAGIPDDLIRILGYSVDTSYYAPVNRSPSSKVRLLYVVSNLNRKDPGLLLRAYFAAFKKSDPVVLTLKIRMTEKRFWEIVGPQFFHKYDINSPDAPEIRFVSGTVSEDVVRSIYEEADIYVTTERAKGWDYPVMEAMAMGIPSISIDWSGSEFLNEENAYLIPPRQNLALVHSTQVDNAEMYFGHKWADVDEAEVVRVMRDAIANREDISRRGNKCRQDVMRYSPEAIGSDMQEMLLRYADVSPVSNTAVLYY